MLKFITNYFCQKALNKQAVRTQSKIAEYEREAAAVQQRLDDQAAEYRRLAKEYQKRREADYKELTKNLNVALTAASNLTHRVGSFQDLLFLCLETWMHKDLAYKKQMLLYSGVTSLQEKLSLLNAFENAINELNQTRERMGWSEMVKTRPLEVSSHFIIKTISTLERTQEIHANQFKHDVYRIKSEQRALRPRINAQRAAIDEGKKNIALAESEHQFNKNKLIELYEVLMNDYNDIEKQFCTTLIKRMTVSPLADAWLQRWPNDLTIKIARSLHGETKSQLDLALEHKNCVFERLQTISSRIQHCHDKKEFGQLSSLKSTKNDIKGEIEPAKQAVNDAFAARDVIYNRISEVSQMLGAVAVISPNSSIDKLIEMLSKDHIDFNHMNVFGINTPVQKRLYYERKKKDGQIKDEASNSPRKTDNAKNPST